MLYQSVAMMACCLSVATRAYHRQTHEFEAGDDVLCIGERETCTVQIDEPLRFVGMWVFRGGDRDGSIWKRRTECELFRSIQDKKGVREDEQRAGQSADEITDESTDESMEESTVRRLQKPARRVYKRLS